MVGNVNGKVLNASATVLSVSGTVYSLSLVSDGANAGTAVIKDGGSSGTSVYSLAVPATAGSVTSVSFPEGLRCRTDIYAAIANCTLSITYM